MTLANEMKYKTHGNKIRDTRHEMGRCETHGKTFGISLNKKRTFIMNI